MKIGIHNSKRGFHPHWVSYCKIKNIPYKLVNCYKSDIIQQLKGCSALLWHHHHNGIKDVLFAKQLLFALQKAGIIVFPDFNTGWHFDDKVGQKYLLEALGLPLINSYVFYEKDDAINWAKSTTFPKVWKLRGGAGSSNVSLVKNKKEAFSKIQKAFETGFESYNRVSALKERYRKYRNKKITIKEVFKSFLRIFYPPKYSKVLGKQIGYIYFQDFIPNNDSDFRVIVIGDRAIAIKRMVRKGDFKASGSGHFLYDVELFDNLLIKTAFETVKKIGSECCAFDFVYLDGVPLIVEISYGFASSGYEACPGYWDSNLNFHVDEVNPYNWIVDDIVKK